MSAAQLLAVDPGPELSAAVLYDVEARRPVRWAKESNEVILAALDGSQAGLLAVEWIASYGMPVGAETFETCVWKGRFVERWLAGHDGGWVRVFRREVKLHLCDDSRAKDSNIRQALIDRYGPGRDRAVGRKAAPGPLYGFKVDCWQALGVAITAAETGAAVPALAEPSQNAGNDATPAQMPGSHALADPPV